MFITCGSTDIRGQKGRFPVLTIFRRHVSSCSHTSRSYRRCKCPIHVEGSLGGEKVRRSLDLTSWEAASTRIAEWNAIGRIPPAGASDPAEPKRLEDAIEKYLADAQARNLRDSTIRLMEGLLRTSFLAWANDHGYRYLAEIDVERLRDYRAGWKDAPITAAKKLERLRAFYRFCHTAEWVTKNPATALAPPKIDAPPTLPFTRDEWNAIVAACDSFAHNGKHAWQTPKRVRAFVYLLRYSGLRISDAVLLSKSKVLPNGSLFLRTLKTGATVAVPLPPAAIEALSAVTVRGEYFFWSGNGKLKSALSSWDRTLRILFRKAKVNGGHAHRFRDTFSVSLLENGASLEEVQVLLGHASVKVTEKHYAPWVKSRQDRLEERIRSTWM